MSDCIRNGKGNSLSPESLALRNFLTHPSASVTTGTPRRREWMSRYAAEFEGGF